jgi:hypothetical protein
MLLFKWARIRSNPIYNPRFGAWMSQQEMRKVVFRVQSNTPHGDTRLIAYELAGRIWLEGPLGTWASQRQQLLGFGIPETHLLLTDEAFAGGTRDAQFAAVDVDPAILREAGFKPKIW